MNLIIKILNEFTETKFQRDTIWLISAQALLAMSGILINVIVGNKYGSENLGLFNQGVAIFFLISAILSIGLNNTTIKKISEDSSNDSKNKVILNNNLFISIVFSLSIVFILYFVINQRSYLFSHDEVAISFKIFLICIPLYNINKILMSFLIGMRFQEQFAKARFIRWTSLFFLILICAILDISFQYIYYSFLFSEFILFIYIYTKVSNYFSVSISKEIIKKNLKFGIKSYLSEIISYAKDRLDIIIVGYFVSKLEMGVFTFSYSFASGVLILSSVFMQNLNPIISEMWKNEKYHSLFDKISLLKSKVIYFQSFFLIVIFIAFNFIMPMITNIPIEEHMLIFNILLFGFYIFSLNSWLGSFLIMTGNLSLNIIRVLIVLVFSISLLFIMSYCFGLFGAAVSIFLISVMNYALVNFFVKYVLRGKI